MIDKILLFTLLLDFYGELLTEKQNTVFELYYLNDFSLNEIAEVCGVTPQGVRDLLQRTKKILENYDSKLKLIEKHLAKEKKNQEILNQIDILEKNMEQGSEHLQRLKKIKVEIMELNNI